MDLAMCDEWMPVIRLPITFEQFQRLPQNPAYKYEYFDRRALLSPRPKHYHALLDLKPLPLAPDVTLRRLRQEDIPELEHVFAAAFRTTQPFGSLSDEELMQATHACLERSRSGGDGPWIESASFVALEDRQPRGAIWITLLPPGDPLSWDSYHWKEPAPPDAIIQRLGRPHLTWIFVSPWCKGEGVGTALLAAAVKELLALGYTDLLTTFMGGNDSSMLWHWRNGFRLLPHIASKRLMRQKWQQMGSDVAATPPTPKQP